MVYVRLVLMIAVVVAVAWGLYRMGKGQGWWGQTLTPATAKGSPQMVARPVAPRTGGEVVTTTRDPIDSLTSQIWSAVLKHPGGVWLYSRQSRMLRITLAGSVAASDAVLYLERVEGDDYCARVTGGSATLQIFTFKRGARPVLQSVTVKAGGPPDYELELARDIVAAQTIAGVTPTDDMLRKLVNDLNCAQVIDDVQ
jgi:hypothetical protein